MRLLVSVSTREEAVAAFEGGADLIDAKDPARGALGAVSPDAFSRIQGVVARRRPVTAALGDARDESTIARIAHDFAVAGADLVKVGFQGVRDPADVLALARAAVGGAQSGDRRSGTVVVGYADADCAASIHVADLVRLAPRTGATGILIDTLDKYGPGLASLVDPGMLARWVAEARAQGLLVALAGRLTLEDIPRLRDTGADIVGVRGAACAGGRSGRVDAERVRALHARCQIAARSEAGSAV